MGLELLKFTPLEFETRKTSVLDKKEVWLKFTPLEFETFLSRTFYIY